MYCELYKNEEKNKNVIGVATDKVIYSGDVQKDEFYNNFLVVVDKKTNKVN